MSTAWAYCGLGWSERSAQPLPPAPWASAVVRSSQPRRQQVRAQPVDDQLLRSAERLHHVRCLDIEAYLEVGYPPRLDLRRQLTEERLLFTGWSLLESQEQMDLKGAHRPRTLYVPHFSARSCWGSLACALGRLHGLAADLSTGGGAGSRAGEAKNSRRWVQGPDGSLLGVLGRALDAAPEPVRLTGRREAAHPTQGDAA